MPNPYVTQPPQLIYDFTSDPASSWVQNGSGATGSVTDSPLGIRIQSDGTGAASYYRGQLTKSLDMTGTGDPDELVHVVVAFEGGSFGVDQSEATKIRVLFGTDPSPAINDRAWMPNYQMQNNSGPRTSYNVITLKKSQFLLNGNFVADGGWSNINQISTRVGSNFGTFDGDLTLVAIYLGGSFDMMPIMFSFDDCDVEQYTVVAPILEAAGMRGTFFVTPNRVGLADKMTLAQLQDLKDRGHSLINHNFDHSNRDDGGQNAGTGAVIAAIDAGDQWMRDNLGITTPYYAHTSGQYNQAIIDHLDSIGYRGARNASPMYGPESGYGQSGLFDFDQYPRKWELSSYNLNQNSGLSGTAALLIPLIDQNYELGQLPSIYGHIVSPTPGTAPGSPDRVYDQAEFQAVVDHIKTTYLDTGLGVSVTVDEYGDAMLGLPSANELVDDGGVAGDPQNIESLFVQSY